MPIEETSWRADRKESRLRVTMSAVATVFTIAGGRGGKVAASLLESRPNQVVKSDRSSAHDWIAAYWRPSCWGQLRRDLEAVEESGRAGPSWPGLAKKPRRFLGDAIRLKGREDVPAEEYAWRRARLSVGLDELIATAWDDPQAKRLIKRLRRHRDDLSTSLDEPDVPFDENYAGRAIRPEQGPGWGIRSTGADRDSPFHVPLKPRSS